MTGKNGGSSIFLVKILFGPILDKKDQKLPQNVIFRILWKILSLIFFRNKLKWKIMLLLIFLCKLGGLLKHNAFCKLMLSFGGWTWLDMPRVHRITNLQFRRNSFLDFIYFFLYAEGHPSELWIDTTILEEFVQACPKYPKQQARIILGKECWIVLSFCI